MAATARATTDAAISYRAMTDADRPFVFSTWMKWARQFAPWLRLLPDRVFWNARTGYRAHVESVINRANIIIACDPEMPEMVLGYAVTEPPRLLHFVFVDRDVRRRAGGRLPESIGGAVVRKTLPRFGQTETVVTLDRPAFSIEAQRHRLKFDPFAAPLGGREFQQWATAWRESLASYPKENE